MDKSIINEMIQSFELEVGRMSLKEAKEYYERYGLELDSKAWKKLNERAHEQEQETVLDKIKSIVAEWKTDTWTDNFSYECMIKIAEIIDKVESEDKE